MKSIEFKAFWPPHTLVIISCIVALNSCASKIDKIEKQAQGGKSYQQYRMYEAYIAGDAELGTKRDTQKAHSWLERSAGQGYREAQKTLIKNHLQGYNGYAQSRGKAISLAKQYGNSFSYPLIRGGTSWQTEANNLLVKMNAALRELQNDLDRDLRSATLKQKVYLYNRYATDLGKNLAQMNASEKILRKMVGDIQFVNYLNKLNLEGVSFPTPAQDEYQQLIKVKENTSRVSENMRSRKIDWSMARNRAQSSLDTANAIDQMKNPQYGQTYQPRRSGHVIRGAQ